MNFAAEISHGVVTVRAFNMVDRFFKNFLKLVDTDASLFFHSNVVMEWVILRVEAIQNLTVITAALLLILLPRGYVSSGIIYFLLFRLRRNIVPFVSYFSLCKICSS
jgi:hypothetical protein